MKTFIYFLFFMKDIARTTMKTKTYLWEHVFSLLFLLFYIRSIANLSNPFLLLLLGFVSYFLLFSGRKDYTLISYHNLTNILLITIVLIRGLVNNDVVFAYIFSILGLILTVIGWELEDDLMLKKPINNNNDHNKHNPIKKQINEEKNENVNEKMIKENINTEEKSDDEVNNELNSKTQKLYVAGKFSNQYHTEDCPITKRLLKKRIYESREKAEIAGLKPHFCVTMSEKAENEKEKK